MRTSGIRLLRKIIGYVLLIVNLMLSVVSALAVYSVVEFISDKNHYQFNPASPVMFNFSTSPELRYLYVGTMTLNNTGLFDFDNFSVEFRFDNITGSTPEELIYFRGSYGDIVAGQSRTISLNFTGSEMRVNSTLNLLSINATNTKGFLKISGKYVLSLFNFAINITNVADWAWIA
jgi:hypothetical protein